MNSTDVRAIYGLRVEWFEGAPRLTWPSATSWFKADSLSLNGLLQLVCRLGDWTSRGEAAGALAQEAGVDQRRAWDEIDRLLRTGVLVERGSPAGGLMEMSDVWSSRGWRPALDVHLAGEFAKRPNYRNHATQQDDVAMMRRYVAESTPPSNYVDEDGPKHALLTPTQLGSFRQRSDRRESKGKISEQELSNLLFYTFGQIGVKKLPVTREHVRKAAPSGGARHPTEGYLITAEWIGEIPPGAHHYNVRGNFLSGVNLCLRKSWIQEELLRSFTWRATYKPQVAVIYTSLSERNRYRYRENFTYRPVHNDVGHVVEILTETASSMNLKVFTAYNMNYKAVAADVTRQNTLKNSPMAFSVLV